MLKIQPTAKKANIKIMEEIGQTRNKKTKGCLHWSHKQKERFKTPYDYKKYGRKTRQRETKQMIISLAA